MSLKSEATSKSVTSLDDIIGWPHWMTSLDDIITRHHQYHWHRARSFILFQNCLTSDLDISLTITDIIRPHTSPSISLAWLSLAGIKFHHQHQLVISQLTIDVADEVEPVVATGQANLEACRDNFCHADGCKRDGSVLMHFAEHGNLSEAVVIDDGVGRVRTNVTVWCRVLDVQSIDSLYLQGAGMGKVEGCRGRENECESGKRPRHTNKQSIENRFFPNVSPCGFVRGKREKRWTLQRLKKTRHKLPVLEWQKVTGDMWKGENNCVRYSGHSRTGHTGHTARLASKLARLANRLPGTNVPGWNFGWPTPKFRMPAPHCSFFV